MAGPCCSPINTDNSKFRRALWFALWVNAAMFFIEVVAGWQAGSVSLLADAVDFFGDATNYVISLSVLSLGMLWRSRAALFKGITMLLFGLAILGKVVWDSLYGTPPAALTMGLVGGLALLANVAVAGVLYAFRSGDADMRSVWLCSRNDAIGNIAVMIAAAGVFGSGQAWPDLAVAGLMAVLAITSGLSVIKLARAEFADAASREQ